MDPQAVMVTAEELLAIVAREPDRVGNHSENRIVRC